MPSNARVPQHSHRAAVVCLMATAMLVAAGILTGAAPHSPGTAADAVTRDWVSTSGTIYGVKAADPVTADHFYDTPSSYDVGGNTHATPVPAGWATTPALNYTSYTDFANDISAGEITYPFQWMLYDPENWVATPVAEKVDPLRYMHLFGDLVRSHNWHPIMAPSLDLAWVAGSLYPRLAGETGQAWYVRIIPTTAGAAADLYVVQNEALTTNISQYKWMYYNSRDKGVAAHPDVVMNSEVSTANGTADQMATAAKSVYTPGYFVASAGDIPTTTQFLNLMEAAGY